MHCDKKDHINKSPIFFSFFFGKLKSEKTIFKKLKKSIRLK